MPNLKIIIGLVLTTLIILIGGIFLVSKTSLPQLTTSQEVHAQVDKTSHDWGNIPLSGGNVQKTFTIKNTGKAVLELANITTSCMCTTVQVVINDQKSPYFGMHSKSSWVGKVPPDNQAEILVEFDPAFHGPSGVGQITRQISLETNDPNQPKLTFDLSTNVTN